MRGIELPANLVLLYVLLHLRFTGLMFSSPVFVTTMAPMPLRYIFSVLLTVCSIGIIKYEEIPLIYFDSVAFLGILGVRELLIGVALGFLSALPLYALRISGEQTGTVIGFSMAQVMDPTTQSETSILGQLNFMMAMWFYFRWNGHLIMIQSLIESLKLVPPGQLSIFPINDMSIGTWLQNLFIIALRIVIPFYCALVLADVGLGFLARTVPQMNVFVVGLPVKVALGFMVLTVMMPLTMDFIFTKFEKWIEFALAAILSWRVAIP